MSDIVERLRAQQIAVGVPAYLAPNKLAIEAAAEIERLRIRERELLHWLQQAQVKSENAKEKAIIARDAANHAVEFALDAELAANRAVTTSQRGTE